MSIDSETVAVRPGQGFDEGRLLDYLRDRMPELGPGAEVRQFRGGQSNPTFLIRSDERLWVLRKKPGGRLLPSAHAIEREYRIMAALAESEVPVPAMAHLCEDDSVIGTPFYVMQGIEGRVFHDVTLRGLPAEDQRHVYSAMARTLARLHAVDWRAAGLSGFGKTEGFIPRQVALWSRQYEAAKTDPIPAMDRLIPWLESAVPTEEPATIAHGDYRLENMIFHPTEPRPLAVLDWELATLGHPLADLAYNCLPWRLPDDFPQVGGLRGRPSDSGIPDEADHVADYCAQSGRDRIDRFEYFAAFSLFRTAAILQGIYARALQSNATGENALQMARFARVAAELALDAARQDGATL